MADTLGYDAERDSMNPATGRIPDDQVGQESGTIDAPGESCRTRLEDVVGEPAPHIPSRR